MDADTQRDMFGSSEFGVKTTPNSGILSVSPFRRAMNGVAIPDKYWPSAFGPEHSITTLFTHCDPKRFEPNLTKLQIRQTAIQTTSSRVL